ncbi:MAG: hypothetical protein KC468_21150 [Myxococcales bacterium]|nr:hypothetical protein [Myxococcales bacterium]
MSAEPPSGARAAIASSLVAVATASQWRAWGVQPSRAVGDGLGARAAAFIAAGRGDLERFTIELLAEHQLVSEDVDALARAVGVLRRDDAREKIREEVLAPRCELERTAAAGPALGRARVERTLAEVAWSLRQQGDVVIELAAFDRAPARALAKTLARLYVRGATIRWDRYLAPLEPRRVDAPTYSFQRARYWLTDHAGAQASAQAAAQGGNRTVLTRLERDAESLSRRLASQPLSELERASLAVLPKLLKRVAGALRDEERASQLQIHPQPRNLEDEVESCAVHTAVADRREPARSSSVRDALRRHVTELLELDDGALDPDRGLFDLGMDSLMLVDLHERLNEEFALTLPIGALFDHPTINLLAGLIAPEVAKRSGFEAPRRRAAPRSSRSRPSSGASSGASSGSSSGSSSSSSGRSPDVRDDAAPSAELSLSPAPELSPELSDEDAIELIARKYTAPE